MNRNCGDIVWIESTEGVCGGLTLVIPPEPRRARSPLWRVSGLCCAYVCDSGLHGRFADARDAALRDGLAAVTTHYAFLENCPPNVSTRTRLRSPKSWPTAIHNVASGNGEGKGNCSDAEDNTRQLTLRARLGVGVAALCMPQAAGQE